MARPKIIAGNWKMHKTLAETRDYCAALQESLDGVRASLRLAVPYTSLPWAADWATHYIPSGKIQIGAQNLHERAEGAFTGEISARMLRDVGATFTLVGHSERRRLFGDTGERVRGKLQAALGEGLSVILCVGETLEERQAGQTRKVLEQQLTEALTALPSAQMGNVVLAYEPVWAIGTGVAARESEVVIAHQTCRAALATLFDSSCAERTPILYGGSVDTANAPLLLQEKEIDGVLVGRAALDPFQFLQIARFAS